jgi:hypothetical protein
MPTAARLAAALCLALTAFVASTFVRDLLSERVPGQFLFPVNVGLGLVVGWWVIGRRIGRGWVPAINAGLTGGVVLAFWVLFAHAAGRMWALSFRQVYKYPPDALKGLMDQFLTYAEFLMAPTVAGSLVLGAVLSGLVAEAVNKRFD